MKREKGITLVELLVVLSIISILSMVSYLNLATAREEAKKGALKATMESLLPAAELYALKNPGKGYQGFCSDNAVFQVEESCKKIFGSCTCRTNCTSAIRFWSITCVTEEFAWTCQNDGEKAFCGP